jgi:O-antigen/teichoic acid export membrane protein
VFGNKAIMMVMNFMLMPVISRIYDQEAFGVFGLLNNMVLVGAAIIGFKLSDTFILKVPEEEFKRLARVVVSLILLGVFVLFVIAVLFGQAILGSFGVALPAGVIVLIPVVMGLFALQEMQVNHTRRINAFKRSAMISTSTDLVGRLSAIAYGLTVAGNFVGLWGKEILRVVLAYTIRAKSIFGGRILPVPFKVTTFLEIRQVLKEYYKFPAYQMPSVLASMFYAGLPLYLIGRYFNIEMLGEYTMAMTMLNFPTYILANSIVAVYQRSAANWIKNEPEKLRTSSLWLFIFMLFIGSVGFGLVYWNGERLFGLFLGEKWQNAGLLAGIMSPMFFARMVAPPIVSLRIVMNTQHWNLIMNLLAVIVTAAAFIVGIRNDDTFLSVIGMVTVFNTVLVVISIFMVFHAIGVKLYKPLLWGIIVLIFGGILSYLPHVFF